jgi:hypothetical protein
MFSRFLVPLVVAVALAFAYGPQSHSSALPAAGVPPSATGASGRVPDTVAAALDVRVGDKVEVTLRVTNHTEHRVELQFPNGQTHEVVVLDADGRPVWRWSQGRLFTQAVQNRMLDAGETVRFVERWGGPPDKAGSYTAVARLMSTSHPLEQRAAFALK